MPLGDIVKTLGYEVTYGLSFGTLVAGRSVHSRVADGAWVPNDGVLLGTHGMFTGLTEFRDGITYSQILIVGYGRGEMGGIVRPNQPIISDATGKFVTADPNDVSTTELWRVNGRYIRLDTDNQYNPSSSVDTDIGIVRIGGVQT